MERMVQGMIGRARDEHKLEAEADLAAVDAVGRLEAGPADVQAGMGDRTAGVIPVPEALPLGIVEERLHPRSAELLEGAVGAMAVAHIGTHPEALPAVEVRGEQAGEVGKRRDGPGHQLAVDGFRTGGDDVEREPGAQLAVEHIGHLAEGQAVPVRKSDDAQRPLDLASAGIDAVDQEDGQIGIVVLQSLEQVVKQRGVVAVARAYILQFDDQRIEAGQLLRFDDGLYFNGFNAWNHGAVECVFGCKDPHQIAPAGQRLKKILTGVRMPRHLVAEYAHAPLPEHPVLLLQQRCRPE